MQAFVFPGQGSQRVGMGEGLFDKYPELIEKADEILGYSVKNLCLKDENKQLGQTQFTQPALYTVNALSYLDTLESTNAPDFVAGHSLGEYNALFAAGVFSFETGLELVQRRGMLMSQAKKGAMAAIMGMSSDEVITCLQDNNLETIDVANFNSPSQTVISGLESDMEKAHAVFEKAGAMFIPLPTSGAFHSRYMQDAQNEFKTFLSGYAFNKPVIPVISNVRATPYTETDIVDNLSAQIASPVRWTDCVYYLLDQGVKKVTEVGIGDVLTKMQTYIEKAYAQRPLPEVEEKVEQLPETATVEDWNRRYPPGTKVIVNSLEMSQTTRTPAVLLFGHRPAIYLEGFSGYFDLSEVVPSGVSV